MLLEVLVSLEQRLGTKVDHWRARMMSDNEDVLEVTARELTKTLYKIVL